MSQEECPEASNLTYASVGALDKACTSPEAVQAFIAHLSQCLRCQSYWHIIANEKKAMVGTRDARIFPDDGSEPWANLPDKG